MKKVIFNFFIILGTPFTFLSALWLKQVMKRRPMGKTENMIFSKIGILPILDHYYQPLINPKKHLKKSLRQDRTLPGIDLNIQEQLDILSKFNFNDELLKFPVNKRNEVDVVEFVYDNYNYCFGDAEYLYNMIRHFKPEKIIEIGSGHSTLMALNAINKNGIENKNYQCEHICIEPYEMSWLETRNVKVIRSKVEDVDVDFFKQLQANDILFIDSTHVIRPQGDVLYEFLEILPVLNKGVIMHIHDILTPKDYLDDWIFERHILWNEQYLLEAFLSFNDKFKIIGAANFLSHNYRDKFYEKCPVFAKHHEKEPGAFWIQRI